MSASRNFLAVGCTIGLMATTATTEAGTTRQNHLKRRNVSSSSSDATEQIIQLDNPVDLLHDEKSRHLQGPPKHPELSTQPNGNKISASATFHQGGQRSIHIFDKDCSSESPIQFAVGDVGPAHAYTYFAPANPASSTVDFEISLVGISSVETDADGDYVLCVQLETANTLRNTILKIDLDLFGEYTFDVGGTSTPSSSDEMELISPFTGGDGSFGAAFDVVAKDDALLITSLDIHTRVLTPANLEPDVDVQVYTKAGSIADYATEPDRSKWRKVVDTKIRGMGSMNASPISAEDFEAFTISPGETHALYVTLESADLRYTSSDVPFGKPVVSNQHLVILQGSGIGDFPWGPAFKGRQWNGSIKYKILDPATNPVTSGEVGILTAETLADAGLIAAGQGQITTNSTANDAS